MKKLMFAASAALCAAVGFCGVTSANVVGYGDNNFVDGSKMMSMNFKAIGSDGMKVSDLKPAGYLENPAYTTKRAGGIQGTIYFEILGDDGDTMMITKDVGGETTDEYTLKWAWYHTWTQAGGWQNDARWVDDFGEVTVGDPTADYDADYLIPTGTAIWLIVDGWDEGMKFTLSGEALLAAQNVELVDGAKAMAIPLSCDVALWNTKKNEYNVYPTGYLENPAYTTKRAGGIQGTIYFEILGDDGDTMMITKDVGGETTDEYTLKWAWYHTWTQAGGWQNDARWVDDFGEVIVGDPEADYDANYTLPMGSAIWVVVDGWDEGMTMSFPGVDDL